jgi:hypothetical protein
MIVMELVKASAAYCASALRFQHTFAWTTPAPVEANVNVKVAIVSDGGSSAVSCPALTPGSASDALLPLHADATTLMKGRPDLMKFRPVAVTTVGAALMAELELSPLSSVGRLDPRCGTALKIPHATRPSLAS